jgi:hypothetical protein
MRVLRLVAEGEFNYNYVYSIGLVSQAVSIREALGVLRKFLLVFSMVVLCCLVN